jgi:RNA polymerase-binding transcription factor DksA
MLDLKLVKNQLMEKLTELQERATEIEDSLTAAKHSDSEERAVELETEETATAIGRITDSEILDIKLALRRIDSGEYTTCAICGKRIAKERLVALPWTSRCTACA